MQNIYMHSPATAVSKVPTFRGIGGGLHSHKQQKHVKYQMLRATSNSQPEASQKPARSQPEASQKPARSQPEASQKQQPEATARSNSQKPARSQPEATASLRYAVCYVS